MEKYKISFFSVCQFNKARFIPENYLALKKFYNDIKYSVIIPSKETVSNGSYNPLSRPIFIYANNSSKERKEVEAFVTFYLKNAGDLVSDVGYIPLTKNEYELELNKFMEYIK